MKNILFIHQSAELYGSDKTLLLLVKNLDKNQFQCVVILPNNGPLKEILEKENITVVVAPVLKLYRRMFVPKNIFIFVKDTYRGFKILNALHKTYKFDLVYSNTLAVLIGLFFAKKQKIKHLWHVHEIIKSPIIFSKAYRFLLSLKSNTTVVYNSVATQNFWNNKKIALKSNVILNGLDGASNFLDSDTIGIIRQSIFKSTDSKEVCIALVGRINSWKGHLILLNAFYELSKSNTNIKLIFIGSPPANQDYFLNELNTEILKLNLTNQVVIVPFYNNIFDLWQAVDIAVVPSTEPEPFGLVAVEAMLAKKPVVASNHGGLTEIIEHSKTGFLVQPNNISDLKQAIQKLIENPALRTAMGINGFERAKKYFSVDNYVNNFETIFNSMLQKPKK